MSLLEPGELCAAILSLPQCPISPPKDAPEDIASELNSFFYEPMSKKEIDLILNDLKGKAEFTDSLMMLGYAYPFRPQLLQLISRNRQFRLRNFNISFSIIINSFLSWSVIYQQSHTNDHTVIVLRALKEITATEMSESEKNISNSAFYHAFSSVMWGKPDETSEECVEILESYFADVGNIPIDIYDLLSKASMFLIDSTAKSYSALGERFIKLVIKQLRSLGNSFPVDVINTVVQVSCSELSSWDYTAITLFSRVAAIIGFDTIKPYIALLPMGLIKIIEESDVFLNRGSFTDENLTSLNDDGQVQYSFKIMKQSIFDQGIPELEEVVFPEILELTKLIPLPLLEKLRTFVDAFSNNTEFIQDLYEVINQLIEANPGERSYDKVAALLYIFDVFHKRTNLLPKYAFFGTKLLFDPHVTVYTQSENWEQVSSLRSMAVDLSIQIGLEQFLILLQEMKSFPLVFAECIYRFLPYLDNFKNEELSLITKHLMIPLIYYQIQSDLSEKDKESVKIARLSIIKFIEKIMISEDRMSHFFESNECIDMLFTLIFEAPFRPFVISLIYRYIIGEPNALTNEELINKIAAIITYLCESLNDNYVVIMCIDLLEMLNTILEKSFIFATRFHSMVKSFCKGTVKLVESEESKQLLLQVTRFIHNCLIVYIASWTELSALEKSITTVFGENPPAIIYERMMQLSARKDEIEDPFEIVQEKPLQLIFKKFIDSEIASTMLNKIEELCKFSEANSIKMHEISFDSLLLDYINKCRTNKDSDVDKIRQVLSIFQTITSNISTFSIVQQFVSIFSPIDNKHLPAYQIEALNTLSSLIPKEIKNTLVTVELRPESTYSVRNVTTDLIENGFTVYFWIYPHYSWPDYKIRIITLRDTKQEISVYITWDSLIISINGNEIKSEEYLMTKEWTFITVSLDFIEKSLTMTINETMKKGISFNPIKFSQGELKCFVCGVSEKSVIPELPSLLSRVALTKLMNKEQIYNVFTKGESGIIANAVKTIFLFVPRLKDGMIYMNNAVKGTNIKSDTKVLQSDLKSFTDILVHRCGVSWLLPLLNQWDTPFIDGKTQMKDISTITIDILSRCLRLDKDGQKAFAKSEGVGILSHLLITADAKHTNLELYMSLYNLFDDIKCKELKRQLFSCILTNNEIWMRCPPLEHDKIVQHWDEVLFPKYYKDFRDLFPMSKIFNYLRVYYWYTAPELQFIYRRQAINVPLCRKYLLNIAKEAAKIEFSEADMSNIVSNIVTCLDHEQGINLFSFLEDILNDESIKLPEKCESLSQLQYLMAIKNVRLQTQAMKTIINVHSKNLIPGLTLEAHLDVIHHQLASDFPSMALLKQFIMINEPALFPILSWMAFCLREEGITLLYNAFTPKPELATHYLWATWPIVTALNCNQDNLKEMILKFLVECSISTLPIIYATLEIIGRAISVDPTPTIAILMNKFSNNIAEKQQVDSEDLHIFFYMVRHFLFFRSDNEPSYLFGEFFQKSIFYLDSLRSFSSRLENARKRRKSRRSINQIEVFPDNKQYTPEIGKQAVSILMPHRSSRRRSLYMVQSESRSAHLKDSSMNMEVMPFELDNMIIECSSTEIIYHFGLRLDDDQNWMDQDLASQALEIYFKNQDYNHTDTAVVIISYLLNTKHEKLARKTIAYIISKHSENFLGSLSLYHYKLNKTNIEEAFNFLSIYTVETSMSVLPLQYLKQLLRFMENNSKSAFDIFAKIDEIAALSRDSVCDFNDIMKQTKSNDQREWMHFWHCMTSDKAPWVLSLPSTDVQNEHFKRDRTFCYGDFPMKLCQNFKYDDHMQASLTRDIGSQSSAASAIEKMKNELTKKYAASHSNRLFDIIEDTNAPKDFEDNIIVSTCILELQCEIIKISKIIKNVSFVLMSDQIVLSYTKKTFIFKFDDITNIFMRTRFHHPTAIEIYINDGNSVFINFPDVNSLTVLRTFKSVRLPKKCLLQNAEFKSFFGSSKKTDAWVNNNMSNFKYIMALNQYSGRTFNDISQYPVFPWILVDYTSDALNLDDPNIYRDLTKPVGALSEQRLADLKDNAEQLTDLEVEPYLYSSSYSCPLTVCLWLIRLEPFTSSHIEIQGGRFDHAARLFSSMTGAFKLASTNQNDYRELVPEFFFLPEFLINSNHFNLGETVNGKIDDVVLPPWAKNPYDFVYMHRKALESKFVTANLHNWIDLIWGDKQKGEKAWQANNVFMRQMYADIWTQENFQDSEERAQIEAILCHVGQIPPQLFDRPHPKRNQQTQKQGFNMQMKLDTSVLAVGTYIKSSLSLNFREQMTTNKLRLFYLSEHLRLTAYEISLQNNPSTKQIKQSASVQKAVHHVESIYTNDSFIFVGEHMNELIRVTNDMELVMKHRTGIISLACSGRLIVMIDKDAVITLFKNQNFNKAYHTIPSFTGALRCCAVDDNFHTVVCGAKNGYLLLISANQGVITKMIDISGYRPIKILITPAWGFILVYSTLLTDGKLHHFMTLYSINGELLKKITLQCAVVSWSAYKSSDDFDYIAFADEEGKCYTFEAFFLQPKQVFDTHSQQVAHIECIDHASTLLLVLNTGEVIFHCL